MDAKETGRRGEAAAVAYLQSKGYRILARNFELRVSRFLKSEIDIVAKKQELIVFVEVKALTASSGRLAGIDPEEKVGLRKKKKLIRCAEAWLAKNKVPFDSPWQIDIIAVTFNPLLEKIRISHFENAVGQNRAGY
jgi:putative endonuclease